MTGRQLTALVLGCALSWGAAAAVPAPATAMPAVTEVAATPPPPSAVPEPTVRAAPGRPPAAQPVGPAVGPQYAPGPSAGSLVQTILALMLVLAMLAALAWVLKRYGPRGQAGAGGLRIVSAVSLGGRERVIVVEVGDQWIVVGASPGRVNALATMPRQEAPAAPANATLHPHAPAAGSFGEWLKQTIEKRNAK